MSTDRSLRELMSLDGRVALVTGGAGHIGRVIAGGLAELGANIAIVDMPASQGAEVAAKLSESWPVKAAMFECDFEQSAAVRELPQRVREKFGRIDVIVNCAAFVETLVAQGVTDTFGIVGSAYMDAHDLFPLAGIRFVSVAHEQNAAHGRRDRRLFDRRRGCRFRSRTG